MLRKNKNVVRKKRKYNRKKKIFNNEFWFRIEKFNLIDLIMGKYLEIVKRIRI